MSQLLIYVLWGLGVLAPALGGYLAGYLKKKGENRAIHEDIEKVLNEVRAVTKATKEIEAEISNNVWDRQKRWELKRDVLLDVAKRVSVAKDALTRFFAVYQTEKQSSEMGKPERTEKKVEAYTAWNEAADGLDQLTLQAQIVCGDATYKELLSFGGFMRNIAEQIAAGQPEVFLASAKELAANQTGIAAVMRKEVEIDKLSSF